ncbi:beta-galactosidase [Gordoniibacillus kamchatkensis]|uniref:Beta-galactosidase n=1 Tax=Gordoniibacillus kamchatkensis TaxID=1590651 RepID=A0ABR5AJZ0_9BACL|nr:glycoside hydrolase family 35 protein [Paenibacillus sp. VKM B-2647]KIL41334.1 beta-galactosidase [Paenibacillus sp. VKM B-2647]
MSIFAVEGNRFTYDGRPVTLISGAIHYFRVVPEYWEDRLTKLKACGFNTVESYVPWNLHEPEEGRFCFEGLADVCRFIEIAGKLGLYVIVRPSPYICAEWEFGGLPAWLLADSDIKLRCYHEPYLRKVDAYYDELLPRLAPLLCTNGGPIIAMQIENEYGSYGNDTGYLEYLQQGMIRRGIDVLLFTSDGPTDSMLQGGTVPGVLATVNFGSRVAEAFDKLKEYQPDKPVMCMEFWNGWFDHWGEHHHTRDAQDVADTLEQMLQAGASVNFYMFHGGTNFGFYNGANYSDKYEPTITSYDYDVLLDESGEPTDKFYRVRSVLEKYMDIGPCALPEPIAKRSYGTVALGETADLFASLERLARPVQAVCPETMEKLGQDYGFILYSTRVSGPRKGAKLHLQDVHDRAQVYVDGVFAGTVERWAPQPLTLDIPAGGASLDILVENMGRVNYGPRLKDSKGITEGVRLDNQFLFGWTMHPLPLKTTESLQFAAGGQQQSSGTPVFYRGTFEADDIADTFLRLDGWTKGVVWINGFNLGRYWERGPQRTLYVPGPLLRKGANEIVVLELHGTGKAEVSLEASPDLGAPEQ